MRILSISHAMTQQSAIEQGRFSSSLDVTFKVFLCKPPQANIVADIVALHFPHMCFPSRLQRAFRCSFRTQTSIIFTSVSLPCQRDSIEAISGLIENQLTQFHRVI